MVGSIGLSPEQAQAILELRLHRLTGLEHEKLINDYQELIKQIAGYLEILGNSERPDGSYQTVKSWRMSTRSMAMTGVLKSPALLMTSLSRI